jgi:hypothetical protein
MQVEPNRQGARAAFGIEPSLNLHTIADAFLANWGALERTGLDRDEVQLVASAVEQLKALPTDTSLLYSFNTAFGSRANTALEELCRNCRTLRRVAVAAPGAFRVWRDHWEEVCEPIVTYVAGSGEQHSFYVFGPRPS